MSSSIKKAVQPGKKSLLGAYKSALLWAGIALVIILFGLVRYAFFFVLPHPTLVLRETEQMPYSMSKGGSFVLEFDQRMNKASVEKHLKIEPELSYDAHWEGRVLYLKPRTALMEQSTYYISLERGPKSFFGKLLEKEYVISFIVGPDPKLDGVFPASKNLNRDDSLIIMFSHPMVSEAVVDKEIQPDFLSLTPVIRGDWKWRNSRVLVFEPEHGFPNSTRFRLQSIAPIETYDETVLRESIDQTYETERLAWERAQEANTQTLSIHEPLMIHLNQEVDMKSLLSHLVLTDSRGKRIEGLLAVRADGEIPLYAISRRDPWSYQEDYRLSLSETLIPLEGSLGLSNPGEEFYRTEEFFDSKTFAFSKDQQSFVMTPEKISFTLKEYIPVENLRKYIEFVPPVEYELLHKDGLEYEIRSSEFSQKRENYKLVVKSDAGPELKKYVSSPKEFPVKPVEPLRVEVSEADSLICVKSNFPLSAKSVIKAEFESYRLAKVALEKCSAQSGFSYAVEKSFLQPSTDHTLAIFAEDLFGQTNEQTYQTKSKALAAKDVILRSGTQNFYTSAKSTADLHFRYTTQNLQKLQIQICKVSSDLAVKIEGTYEEKWIHFSPNAEKCLRYKSYFTELRPKWGRTEDHVLKIPEVLDEVDAGLYYVNISSPSFFDDDGRPLVANGVVNFTRWNVFSKRGDSSLIWISENNAPVSNVFVSLYASDGSVLESGRTNRDGIFFLEKNKTQYEFVTAKKGSEDTLLNIFQQDGFEPSRYHVAFNSDENPYLYQFFVEDSEANAIKGMFILKENEGGSPKPPRVNGATVTLYDQHEDLLWRKYEPMDDFGNLFFEIYPTQPLLDGHYQIGVCLGLHEGVCHGTYLWSTLNRGVKVLPSEAPVITTPAAGERMIIAKGTGELESGEQVKIRLKELVPGIPVLFSLEREKIFHKEVFLPSAEEQQINVMITKAMIPEVIASVVQFAPNETRYDMKAFQVKKDARKLVMKKDASGWARMGTDQSVTDLSEMYFRLRAPVNYSDELLFNAFYPRFGTKIITSAIGGAFPKLPSQEAVPVRLIPELVVIDGWREKNRPAEHKDIFYIAHDKDGNFGSSLELTDQVGEVSFWIAAPEFVRADDQIVIPIELQNHSQRHLNLELVTTADGMKLINGESILLGLSGLHKQTVSLATQLQVSPGQTEVAFHTELKNKDGNAMDQFFRSIPVATSRMQKIPHELITHESSTGSGTIQLPSLPQGTWERRIILSPSPLTYALENIKILLQKENLNFEETLYKRIVEANYAGLMKESWKQQQFSEKLEEKKSTIENLFYYLESRQKNDGGWSYLPESPASHPILSSWTSKSIAVLEQLRFEIPETMKRNATRYLKEELDRRANERTRTNFLKEDVPAEMVFEEMQILNGLSSLTPSGISYANSWFALADKLSNPSLVLLLLTLEDYRDAGVSGMNFKIEELIQILQSRQQSLLNQVWISSEENSATDFLITSWYLEALVRQSSSRSDIPSVITWLVKNKYRQEFQSPRDQFTFLQSMASYLRIYQEQMKAENIRISLGLGKSKSFALAPGQPFQTFSIQDAVYIDESGAIAEQMNFTSDAEQPLFMEINFRKLDPSGKPLHNGVSLYQSFHSDQLSAGQKVRGTISLITSRPLEQVLVAQPIISGAKSLDIEKPHPDWEVKTLGPDEKWYLIPELPAGETKIPFEWELTHAGIFKTPQVHAYVINQPKTLSSSNVVTLEIKNQ